MSNRLQHLLVNKNKAIIEVMREIDLNGKAVAFLLDDKNKFFGIVTDGDIRAAILKGAKLDSPVDKIANTDPITILDSEDTQKKAQTLLTDNEILQKIPREGSLKIPVIGDSGEVVDIFYLYPHEENRPKLVKNPYKAGGVKKVLVVGGAGYLGSEICKKLLSSGYKVRVLDNLLCGDSGIKNICGNEDFELIKGDIRNISAIVESIKGMDAVIHLAALVGDPACAINPQKTIEINNFSTKLLGEVCKYNQINRFIFASTCSVYGASSDERFLNENSPLNPVSLYADMKLLSEKSLLELSDGNFSPIIFRMPTLFGVSDRMRFDLAINKMTADALRKGEITVFGGEQWRPFLHIRDAAEFYVKALELPIDKIGNTIINVGGDKLNYRIIEIGKIVQKLTAAKLTVKTDVADQRNYRVDFSLCKEIFGMDTKIDVEMGVKEIMQLDKNILDNYESHVYNNTAILKMSDEES